MAADDALPRELAASLRTALLARGISALTPVQARALAPVRDGSDVSVCSPTGSGKTLAYCLPLADAHCAAAALLSSAAAGPSVLVILPTRELAAQVHAAAAVVTDAAGVRAALCAGGAPLAPQEAALRDATAPPHWVIGTPGRLKDLAERGTLQLAALRTQVLDEADRLLDEGMVDDVVALLRAPGGAQTLMLSATWPPAVARLAAKHLLPTALHVSLSGQGGGGVGGAVRHVALLCPRLQLAAALLEACDAYARGAAPVGSRGAALAFCDTRDFAAQLADATAAASIAARPAAPLRVACLHGGLPQRDRDAALAALRAGETDLLVATDVAARGLDIPSVELVAHAVPPGDGDAYTHRAGRAGRPGCAAPGVSLLLYRPEEGRALGELERAATVAFERIASLSDDRAARHLATAAPAVAAQQGVRTPAQRQAAAADGARLLVTDRMAMLSADLAELGARTKGKGKGKR